MAADTPRARQHDNAIEPADVTLKGTSRADDDTGPVEVLTADVRAGETPSQDTLPTDEDLRLEAALVQRAHHTTNLEDWTTAGRRLRPGLESEAAAQGAGDEEDVDDAAEVDEAEEDGTDEEDEDEDMEDDEEDDEDEEEEDEKQ